ncbi:MAG: glycoside hydrolase family 32 protein [Cyclobacteriaceae bacterium]
MRLKKYWVPVLMMILMACQSGEIRDDGPDEEPVLIDPNYYQEKYRPQVHFSPEANWMNDPNGMFYYQGEYHLFYQYYPDSTVWGPMHWGHAVSEDLINWEHLPIALYPDSLGYIFSGSAVVDKTNSSGFGTEENPPIVAIFTYHSVEKQKAGRRDVESQGLAYSIDKGRTWTKYEGNPVLLDPTQRDFRDPKVIWHSESHSWIMTLAVKDHVAFYYSKDLKTWDFLSEFGQEIEFDGGVWECPDLFPLQVEKTGEQKWVLLVSFNSIPGKGSGTLYFVGDFDGTNFKLDNDKQRVFWLDHGRDNYAGVTFSDIHPNDGRRILMGWMSNWEYAQQVPTHPWRSAMTLPRELSLYRHKLGYMIKSYPVAETQMLRRRATEINRTLINVETDWSEYLRAKHLLLDLELIITKVVQSNDWSLELSNEAGERFEFGYDSGGDQYFVDRSESTDSSFSEHFASYETAERLMILPSQQVKIILDNNALEFYGDMGQVVFTEQFYPKEKYSQLKFKAPEEVLVEGVIYRLSSVWQE